MKKLLFFVLLSSMMNAQTITFKGCIPLFDDQNFVFSKTGTDATGRNIYITTPVDGQDCSGLGTCEFMFQWNSSTSKWEFLADRGDGDFINPNLIYSNTSSSAPNPPDLSLGTWVENTSVTSGVCGGDLTSSNATLTGAVQSSVLSTSDLDRLDFKAYPNPVKDYLVFSGKLKIKSVELISYSGQKLSELALINGKVNLSNLKKGFYILKLDTDKGEKTIKIIKD